MPLDKDALASLRIDREDDSGRYRESFLRRHRRWIWIAVGVLVAILVVMRWSGAAVEVQTAVIEAPEGSADGSVLNATGYVVARRLATVSSRSRGASTRCCSRKARRSRPGRCSRGSTRAPLVGIRGRAERPVAARKRLREIEVRLAEARDRDRNQSLVASKLVAQSVPMPPKQRWRARGASRRRARQRQGRQLARIAAETLDDYESARRLPAS
jgi:hypothetical protein